MSVVRSCGFLVRCFFLLPSISIKRNSTVPARKHNKYVGDLYVMLERLQVPQCYSFVGVGAFDLRTVVITALADSLAVECIHPTLFVQADWDIFPHSQHIDHIWARLHLNWINCETHRRAYVSISFLWELCFLCCWQWHTADTHTTGDTERWCTQYGDVMLY